MSVYIGDVQTFAGVIADKPQVLKIGEEVMEVFSAWEDYKYAPEFRKDALIAEIADVIQAACNLLAAVGVDDMRQPMQACYVRNRERGREYSSSDDMDSAVYVQNCLNESCRQYANQVERADLPDCGSDSREKLEADACQFVARAWEAGRNFERRDLNTRSKDVAWSSDELIALLDRQAAITERECRKPNWDYCETCEALEELQDENDGLKARVESLRAKLSKMLDAASAIQHIGDLP